MAQINKDASISSKDTEITEGKKIVEVVKMGFLINKGTEKYSPVMTFDFNAPTSAQTEEALIDQIMTPRK